MKKQNKTFLSLLLLAALSSCSNNKDCISSKTDDDISSFKHVGDYNAISSSMVVEGYEFGPAVKKVVVEFDGVVKDVTKDDFFLNTNSTRRVIEKVYFSDEKGNEISKESKYLTFELEVKYQLASPFITNYETSLNQWVQPYMLLLTLKDGSSFTVGDTLFNDSNPFRFGDDLSYSKIIPSVDGVFKKDIFTSNNQSLNRALFTPMNATKDSGKNPLIIWLHGLGEGGDDIDIALLGNEVTALCKDEIQSYFTSNSQKGAYVLIVQAPTMWMDDGNGKYVINGNLKDGQKSIYTQSLFKAINDVVRNNSDIDPNRIYLGGCSNGGYMSMNMMFNYPSYFAAYFPICEAYMNYYISDGKIDLIKDKNIFFVHCQKDDAIDPYKSTLPLYYRLIEKNASNIHLSLLDKVMGKDIKGQEYYSHFSWIPFFNNEINKEFDNSKVKNDINNITIENGILTSKNNYLDYKNCAIDCNIFSWLSKQSL